MQHVQTYVARQPIFDASKRLYGYELLFRDDLESEACDDVEPTAATKQVLANGLLTLGLDALVGSHQAFVNFGRQGLLEGWPMILPKETAVIEILETVKPDADVVAACRDLRDRGYQLALDDFAFEPAWEPLLELVQIVKVEIKSAPRKTQEALVAKFRKLGLRALAEKVETHEEFQWARTAGYEYFQGYFFAKPMTIAGRVIPACKPSCARLVEEAQRPDLDFRRLETLISGEVGLTCKLLRYVNSALIARRSRIESIRHALQYVADPDLRRWISLAVLQQMGPDKPGELLRQSLIRARMTEAVADSAGQPSARAFLIGLFSLLDALTDQPLREALKGMSLDEEITSVLTGTAPDADLTALAYRLILAYESASWVLVDQISEALRLRPEVLVSFYRESVHWTDQIVRLES